MCRLSVALKEKKKKNTRLLQAKNLRSDLKIFYTRGKKGVRKETMSCTQAAGKLVYRSYLGGCLPPEESSSTQSTESLVSQSPGGPSPEWETCHLEAHLLPRAWQKLGACATRKVEPQRPAFRFKPGVGAPALKCSPPRNLGESQTPGHGEAQHPRKSGSEPAEWGPVPASFEWGARPAQPMGAAALAPGVQGRWLRPRGVPGRKPDTAGANYASGSLKAHAYSRPPPGGSCAPGFAEETQACGGQPGPASASLTLLLGSMAALRRWLWLHRVRGRAGGAVTAAQSPRLKTARSDFAPTISTICKATSTVYRTPAIGSRFCCVVGGVSRAGGGA